MGQILRRIETIASLNRLSSASLRLPNKWGVRGMWLLMQTAEKLLLPRYRSLSGSRNMAQMYCCKASVSSLKAWVSGAVSSPFL